MLDKRLVSSGIMLAGMIFLQGCGAPPQTASIQVISPATGVYTSSISVTITANPPGSTIYYTTNNSTPTTSSTVYAGPIQVLQSETVSAIATAPGFQTSPVSNAAYALVLPAAATPTFTPAAGTYSTAQNVSIADTTTGASIYYTTDGSTPTTTSNLYSAPIVVSSSETIKAIAVAVNFTNSAVATGSYVLPTATPVFSPPAGTYTSIQTVAISDASAGSSIYYTTNGSVPTTSSTLYAGPITVSSSETINAIATSPGNGTSAVASAVYTINLPPAATPVFSVPTGTYSSVQTVSVTDATAGASIYYTINGSTPTTSSTLYTGPITVATNETINAIAVLTGNSHSAVATATYTFNFPPAVTPAISVPSGTYNSVQTVSITDTTPAASIYYTTDGSTPTTSSTLYKSPITVSSSETLNAIAIATGFNASPAVTATYVIITFTGTVMSGTLPVSGATIQLYAAGATGYTSQATPDLTSSVTTGTNGSFSISSKYACAPGTYLYLTASGGTVGSNASANPNLALMAVVGLCDNLATTNTSVVVNEETTVAMAYALAQFSQGTTFGTTLVSEPGSSSSAPADNFATSSTNLPGLANAMAIAPILVNTATGNSPGNNSTGSISGLTAVTIGSGGTGYTSIPSVTFSAPTSGVTATGIVGVSIGGITITGGTTTGLSACPTVTIATPDELTGTGARAAATVTCTGTSPNIAVQSVSVGTAGSNYTSIPYVTFSNGGTAATTITGAATPGVVTNVNFTAGSGYTSAPTVTFSGGGATAQATASATVGIVSDGNTATAEWWQVNLIANMLQACTNSTGDSGSGTACNTLFTNVATQNGSAPADTLQAALSLALTPTLSSANITALYGLISSAPFMPYPATAASVTDFSIGIQYQPMAGSTTLLRQPSTVTFDSLGNAWVANQPTATQPSQGFLVELTPTGVPIQAGATASDYPSNFAINSYSVGGTYTDMGGQYVEHNNVAQLDGLFAPAIDTNNNLWISDRQNDAMVNIAGSGTVYSNSLAYTNGGNANDAGGNGATGVSLPFRSGPEQTYIDGSNNVFFTMTGVSFASEAATPPPCTTLSLSGTTNLGLGVFIGESTTTVHAGGQLGVNANIGGGNTTNAAAGAVAGTFLAIDPLASTKDVTTNAGTTTQISGTPFVWGVRGGNSGGSTAVTLNYSQPTGTGNTGQGCGAAAASSTTIPEAITSTGTLGMGSAANTRLTAITNPNLSGDTLFPMATVNDITFDKFGNLWIANQGQIDSQTTITTSEIKSAISRITPNYGTAFTPAQAEANFTFSVFHQVASLYDGITTYTPQYLTSDGAGNIWFVMSSAGSKYVNALSNAGAALSPYTVESPGTGQATGGFAGSVCSNCTFNGTTATFQRPNSFALGRPAVDQSGNVWLPINGEASTTNFSTFVDVLVGIAAPRVNPDSLGLKNGTFGSEP